MTLTERGAALLLRADDIFAKSEEINDLFRDKREADEPVRVRVGLVGGISRNFVFRQILRGLENRPLSMFEVVDGSLDELEGMLRSFDLDLIFSLERPRQNHLLTLSQRKVTESPLCLAGTPAAMEALDGLAPGADLSVFGFRHLFEGEPVDVVAARLLGLSGRVRVRTDDISLLRFLANSGRGVAVVPEMGVQEDVASGRLATRSLPQLDPIEVLAIHLTRGARRGIIDAMLGDATPQPQEAASLEVPSPSR